MSHWWPQSNLCTVRATWFLYSKQNAAVDHDHVTPLWEPDAGHGSLPSVPMKHFT